MKVLSTLSIRSRVFEMFYLKEREKVIRNEGFVNTVDTKQVHPVFEMFYLKEREKVIRNEGFVLSTLSI